MREYTASLAISHWDFTGCSSIPGIVAISSVSKSTGIFAQTILLSTFYILHSETWNSYPTRWVNETDRPFHSRLTLLGTLPGLAPKPKPSHCLSASSHKYFNLPKSMQRSNKLPCPNPSPSHCPNSSSKWTTFLASLGRVCGTGTGTGAALECNETSRDTIWWCKLHKSCHLSVSMCHR